MNIDQVLSHLESFAQTHPLAYAGVLAFLGWAGGHFITIIGIVDKVAEWQDARAKAAGLTPAQRAELLEKEAQTAEAAAIELRKRAQLLSPVVAKEEAPKP